MAKTRSAISWRRWRWIFALRGSLPVIRSGHGRNFIGCGFVRPRMSASNVLKAHRVGAIDGEGLLTSDLGG